MKIHVLTGQCFPGCRAGFWRRATGEAPGYPQRPLTDERQVPAPGRSLPEGALRRHLASRAVGTFAASFGTSLCLSWLPLAEEFPLTTWQGRTMGSGYVVKIVGTNLAPEHLDTIRGEVEQRLAEVNRQMSHYQTNSEISQFNCAPAGEPRPLPPEFARVLRFSLELNRRSEGAFDPTLGPLIALWGFGERASRDRIPAPQEIQDALGLTGCRHLQLTDDDRLRKDVGGLSLNLSSTAKGCGVDEMVQVLLRHGWTNVYAAIAGDVRALGHNPRGTPWRVGISAPKPQWRENDPMVGMAALTNLAISTSGDYQKYLTDAQGRRLGHIFDPRTGWPVQHRLGSVTVVAPTSMMASGLATTLFVLGDEKGRNWIEGWTNAAALFVVRNEDGTFRQILSSRFQAMTGYQAQ